MGLWESGKSRAVLALLIFLIASVLFLSGCRRISQYIYLHEYESDINAGTRAIELAQNDAQRAAAYARRGSAMGEKARYSRAFKLISAAEHAHLLDLAMADHGQSIALAPGNAEMYYQRGRTYYGQATLAPMVPEEGPQTEPRLNAAKADFSKAIELDPRYADAYEFRGLTDEGTGDWDQAIADYTQLAALQPKSRYRLADAYCGRGSSYLQAKKYALATADFEKSIDMGTSADGCECEPYNPLLAVYLVEQPDREKARAVARRAKAAGKWIAPEYLEKLK